MSVETELEAIRTGAAIFPLTDRAFLRITGSDATRWLNGMVTNSIQSLQPGEGNYNFLLNAQGRIQGDCTIYREPGEGEATFLLETDKSQIETIQTLLDKFIIMDDVELTPALEDMKGLLIIGPDSSRILKNIEVVRPEALKIKRIESSRGPVILMTPQAVPNPLLLVFGNSKTIEDIEIFFSLSGARTISWMALEAHRILTATPKYDVDIRNTETHKDLPQETAQTHALHFNKGCYLGQEIVERIRSRGQVHRTFTAFTLTGELPSLPAPLEAAIAGQTRPAGELTSAMRIGDTIHALGYLRREFATHPLTYPGGTATPKNPSL